eukprot:166179-Hanusia_phi.AAC.7
MHKRSRGTAGPPLLPLGPVYTPVGGPGPGALVPVGVGVRVRVAILGVPVEEGPERVPGVAHVVGRVGELGDGALGHAPVGLDVAHHALALVGPGHRARPRLERRLVDAHRDPLLVDERVEHGGGEGDGGDVLVVRLLVAGDLREQRDHGVAVVPEAYGPHRGEALRVVAARHDGEEGEHPAGAAAARHGGCEVVAQVRGHAVDIDVLVGYLRLAGVGLGAHADAVDRDVREVGLRRALPRPVLQVHERHGHVVAVDGVDHHGAEVGVGGELDVALPLEAAVREGEGADEAVGQVLRRRLVVVDHQALVRLEREVGGEPRLDQVDDARLEQAVADRVLPAVRDDGGQALPAGELEVAHLLVTLALRHPLAAWDVLVVVEGQHDRLASSLEVAPHAAHELAVHEALPRVHVRRLHQLDLPVDERHRRGEGAVLGEGLLRGLLPDLDPL